MAQPGLEKVAAETSAGQVGSKAEPDLDRVLPGVLELEEAGKLAGLVIDGDVLVFRNAGSRSSARSFASAEAS